MINFLDKCSLAKSIEIEKKSLKSTLDIQKNLNKQILMFMKNFIGKLEVTLDFNPSNKVFKYLNDSTFALNKSNETIQAIQELLTKLEEIKKYNSSFEGDSLSEEITDEAVIYNSKFSNQIDIIYNNTTYIENFIHEISKIDLIELLKELNNVQKEEENSIQKDNNFITISSDELDSSFIENTLIISEIKGIVILPYKINDVKEILLDNNDKYTSIEEVIKEVFTIPIRNYKIPSIARFREAYKLMTKKEKTSKIKALNLAAELFGNYNLHPAIITACNSLDELDIYLACLEDDTLSDFHFFDIKYEIPPAIMKVRSANI